MVVEAEAFLHLFLGFLVSAQLIEHPSIGVEVVGVVGFQLDGTDGHLQGIF